MGDMIFLLLFLLLPFRAHPAGVYNQFTNTISCVPEVCAHEVGHKLDDLAGWGMAVSSSDEWQDAMDLAQPPVPLVGASDVSYEELYAEIFEVAVNKGYMPRALAKFYDLDLGVRLLQSPFIFRRDAELDTGTYPEALFVFYYYEHY